MKAAPRSFFVFLLLQALLLANAVLTRERQRPRQPSGRKDVALKAAVALAESTCKGKPMDLVFIIDSSRSVRPNDYEKMKEFLYSMLTFLDIGPDVTRVGLVQYGSTVNNEFSLKTYNKKADIEKAIREMIHLATGTMTGLALQYTMNVAFTEEEGARPLELNVPRVAMIVTDGRPQDTVDEIAARTRNSGIVIFAVGVGRVDINTLKAMGSRPYEDHVFLVANFSQIEKLPTLFQSKLCDADICSVVDHGCAHICVSSAESYVCKCRTGYTLNPDQKTCSSQDLCAVENHGCEHLCVNVPGSYICQCREGYKLNEDRKTCSRTDFCALGDHGCEHFCVDTEDSYVCQCRQGFTLNPDGRTCSRLDYCALEIHGCEHECVNTEDSYFCRCYSGFVLNPDKKTCRKIDYCALGNHGCEHDCVNTEESFVCTCRAGFLLNPDGKTCTITTETGYCALNNHGCEHNCVNTEESFICTCCSGFILNPDGKTCKQLGYCALGNHGCEHNCINTEDFYVCSCRTGFILNPDGKTCRRCAEGVLDLVFVIDGSKSLGAHNFEVVKQFITGIVDSLEISPNAARVGVVQYSTKVHTEFTLGSYISGKDVKEAVSQIKYMGKGSMTGHALKHMYENSFTDAEGARLPSSKVPKAVIVFTDGRAQDDVSEWANKAKKDGITMYAIGVGKAIEEELREIASEPQEKHVYYAEDFSSMSDIAEKLKTRICEEKPSGEEQCKCENLVAFQDFANKEVRKLTQRLAEMASRLEALEKNIEFK
ncbi:matrilin-2 isoform X3 [Latimeria chalumnae]|uniref:matrilin-2 isoform X3 n=1 Tax=Latimeria chalumnae TaxID=7897 RepID=UPI0006D8E362|nr:PREDICTED: matrilin-2 isoform X3 [Latimeria chalumnae]|eukprot:XP_014346941.1 PREDICTED: matrilin-2 isoform X3 [Latimeria chalumnae]